MAWTVAPDIADRIKNLREFLGGGSGKPILQEELAKRAGVRTSQVSQWERGAQSPSRSRLERWAEREGWPVEMFKESSPMPAELLSFSRPDSPSGSAGPEGTGQVATDPNLILARFYEVMADASRRGQPCPPEMAVLIQRMHGLAVGEGAAPAPSSSTEGGTPPHADKKSHVPGW